MVMHSQNQHHSRLPIGEAAQSEAAWDSCDGIMGRETSNRRSAACTVSVKAPHSPLYEGVIFMRIRFQICHTTTTATRLSAEQMPAK